MNSKVWGGQRILLTGHTRFKGSWHFIWLNMMYAKICDFAFDPPTDPSLFNLTRPLGRQCLWFESYVTCALSALSRLKT